MTIIIAVRSNELLLLLLLLLLMVQVLGDVIRITTTTAESL